MENRGRARNVTLRSGQIIQLRDLTTFDDFREVAALVRDIWQFTDPQDTLPLPILAAQVRRGTILIGGFDQRPRMVGCVYSWPAFKAGKPLQWSHMLAVSETYRSAGLGRILKFEQRQRTLEMGLDLIEWTYDPLQAVNAHFNFDVLGAVVGEYEEDAYSQSSSILHSGTATDRFVAEWWINTPEVDRRSANEDGAARKKLDIAGVPSANSTRASGEWAAPQSMDLSLCDPKVAVYIPAGFAEMLLRDLPLAREWRATTRRIFTTYFARGYRAVGFALDRENRRGAYLLTNQPAAE
jgi:predicted GNAT superfamily acetyltransferase